MESYIDSIINKGSEHFYRIYNEAIDGDDFITEGDDGFYTVNNAVSIMTFINMRENENGVTTRKILYAHFSSKKTKDDAIWISFDEQ